MLLSQTAESSNSKPAQVERAIRVKSTDKRKARRIGMSPSFVSEGQEDRVDFSGSRSRKGQNSRTFERSKYSRFDEDSVRDIRFRVCTKLNELVKDRSRTADEAFVAGEELFESISSFSKRESRLYTAMIRLAVRANKRQKALGYVVEVSEIARI